jgi:hypothetical protein
MKICVLALTVGSLGVMQGLKLQQMSASRRWTDRRIAITLLVADHAVAAGILLADGDDQAAARRACCCFGLPYGRLRTGGGATGGRFRFWLPWPF